LTQDHASKFNQNCALMFAENCALLIAENCAFVLSGNIRQSKPLGRLGYRVYCTNLTLDTFVFYTQG